MPITDIGRNANTAATQTANYTVGLDDRVVPMNATSGALTATLYPAPGDGAFRQVVVYKTDSSANAVTVTDGTFTFSLTNQYDSVTCELTTGGVWVGSASFDVGGSGNVTGPASSTDNAIARFDSTTGKVIQNSTITVSDTGTIAAASGSLTLTTPVIGVATGTSLAATGALTSSSPTAGIGYATGAGGAVTQGTNRTTTVVLNTAAGAITLISAAGSATPASFTVTNSAVAATDTVIVNQKSGTDLYEIFVTAIAAGSFRITSFTTGGTTTETPVFNFAVIKAVAA